MALTSEQLYQVRTWLPWNPPTDAELSTRYDTIGESSIFPLVHEQLRRQLMLALATPAQFSISGEYGQNTAENIAGIRQALKDVEAEQLAEAGGITASSLVRPNPYRAGRTLPASITVGGATRLL